MRSIIIKSRKGNSVSDLTDAFCAFAIVMAPILQHYKGVINGGVTILSIAVPFAIIRIIKKRFISWTLLSVFLTISGFLIFKVLDHGTSVTELGLVIYYIIFIIAYGTGCLKTKSVIDTATMVACIASVCIIFQYVCYYLLHFHLRLVPTSLLLSSANQWVRLALTGRVSITGNAISFYRPSAFFLEPSHMFIYLVAPLIFEILSPGKNHFSRKKAILLSVGIVLSTSGMGIIATIAIWLLYLAKKGGKNEKLSISKLLRPRNILILLSIASLLLLLYFKADFFQRSVNRIFFSGSDYHNAVSGRIESGGAFVSQMRGLQLFIGISDHYSEVEFHMTGFNATMYKFGIIGTGLSYLFYIRCLHDLKDKYFWLAFLLIVTSFFTPHTHGTFYMLFFIIFLLDGYMNKDQSRRLEAIPDIDIAINM